MSGPLRWCEHCRDHFPANHYATEDGGHGAGPDFGPYGVLLAAADEVEVLRVEVERLRERLAEEDAAEAVAERRLGLLHRLEWVKDIQDTAPCCAVCYAFKYQGHDPGCWLAAELKAAAAPPRPAGADPGA